MAQNHSGTRDMTVGPVAGHLAAFTLPLLAGSFLQQLYNMVDSLVVGRFAGDSALAAVGVGFPVIFMFTSLFIGLSNGATVVIAQYYGGGRFDRVRDAIDTTYTAFLSAIIPLTVCAVLLVRPILFIMRVEEAAHADAFWYLTIVLAGIIGSVGYNINAGILGGLGNSRTTLLFLAVSSVLNIVLDILFVAGLKLGAAGAALGTILAQITSWLFGLVYINRRYPELAIRPLSRRFDRELFARIMSIGLPAGVHMSMIALGSMAVMSRVDAFGKEYTAAYNVGSRLDQLAFLPIQSLSSAVTTFVGQNTGAKKPERVRMCVRVSVAIAFFWTAFAGVVLLRFAAPLVALFSETPAVIASAVRYLWCIMPFYPLFAVFFTLNAIMRGAGDSFFPMLNAILSLIMLRVPMVYILAARLGPDYMYYGIGIGWVLGLALSICWYFSGSWKKHAVRLE